MTTVSLPVPRRALAKAATNLVRENVKFHISEKGSNNQGTEVNRFQLAVGGETGESWCLDFQYSCEIKALMELTGIEYTPGNYLDKCVDARRILSQYHLVTGSCGEAMRDAMDRKIWIPASKLVAIKEGWLVLYAWTAAGLRNHAPAHVGRANKSWSKGVVEHSLIDSLEGNTSSGVLGSQSDGDGCFERWRPYNSVVGAIATW